MKDVFRFCEEASFRARTCLHFELAMHMKHGMCAVTVLNEAGAASVGAAYYSYIHATQCVAWIYE